MNKKFVTIISIVILLILILFFWPKSECGYDQGYGDFTKKRCGCLGFIGHTPEFGDIELDSTKDYSCFGIKIEETKIIYQKTYLNLTS